MKLTLMLADAAQVDGKNKVHILGLNWTHTRSPTPGMAVVGIVEADQEQLPTQLEVQIDLLDESGEPAKRARGPGRGAVALQIRGITPVSEFESERTGEPVLIPIVADIGPGLALAPGMFAFRLRVKHQGTGETVEASRKFRIRKPPENRESARHRRPATGD